VTILDIISVLCGRRDVIYRTASGSGRWGMRRGLFFVVRGAVSTGGVVCQFIAPSAVGRMVERGRLRSHGEWLVAE